MALSKDSAVCKACKHYNDCDNKRMEMCGLLQPKENLASAMSAPLTMDMAEQVTAKYDYRDIKIGENTIITINLEEQKKRMKEEIYKELYKGLDCNFLNSAT